MEQQQKPLSIQEIVRLYEKQFNIKLPDTKKALSAIRQAIFQLRAGKKKIQSINNKGKREKLYGLTEWKNKPEIKSLPPVIKKPAKEKYSTPKQEESKVVSEKPKKHFRNKNHNWPLFIKETLNKAKRVLTAKEFLKYAMKYYNIPAYELAKTRRRLTPALSRLEKLNKALKSTIKKGSPFRSYGYTEWFDGEGKLKPEFK